VRIFEEAGADLEKVCIGHQDRRLVWEDHLAVVKSGCRIGYDCISKEHYEPEAKRIEFAKRLVDEGYGDQLVLSGDIARKSYLTSYGGGPGFTYIMWRFVPWLWQEGVSREATDKMLVDNPAKLFAWSA
jgi:phosphotriesterase-related protein